MNETGWKRGFRQTDPGGQRLLGEDKLQMWWKQSMWESNSHINGGEGGEAERG